MPVPVPDYYSDWQAWARAVIQWLGEGDSAVTAGGEGSTGGGPSAPPGFDPIWRDASTGMLWEGNDFLTPPTAPDLFTVDTAHLADLAVELNKLADDAVSSAKLQDLAVLTAHIGDVQVVTAKIADLAVNNAKIANAAITSAKIDNLAVLRAHIAAAAIGSAQIDDLAVTTAKINDAAVTSAKILSLIIDKVTAGTLDAEIDMGTGLIRFTIGGNTLTLGKGFGTSDQFIMWFGPSVDEDLMSEVAAIFYLKTDGSAYFGGSLSAGVLYNAVSTSDLSSSAQIETSWYGSNGGTIQVVLAYSSFCDQTFNYSADSTGLSNYNAALAAWGTTTSNGAGGHTGTKPVSGNVVVGLDRAINAGAYTNDVATLSISGGTETLEGLAPVPGSDPGYIILRRSFGSSITYTDPATIAQDRRYRARLTTRDAIVLGLPNNQQQRISITSTED